MTTMVTITNDPSSHHDVRIEQVLGNVKHPVRQLAPGQIHVEYVYDEKQILIREVPLKEGHGG